MIMLEEFRRRKNAKVFLDARKKLAEAQYPTGDFDKTGEISNKYEERF